MPSTKARLASKPGPPKTNVVEAVELLTDLVWYIKESDDALACVYCARDKARKALLALGIPESDLP